MTYVHGDTCALYIPTPRTYVRTRAQLGGGGAYYPHLHVLTFVRTRVELGEYCYATNDENISEIIVYGHFTLKIPVLVYWVS